ncbi:MAG: hypothetical protein IKN49_01555 [Elusimicrobiaceae bacterium]|nr:hypothetical protein [Elusimicrobiaceae bacterium]
MGWAADFAPAVPDLNLPSEETAAPLPPEEPVAVEEIPAPPPVAAPKKAPAKKAARPSQAAKKTFADKLKENAPAKPIEAPAKVVAPKEEAAPVAEGADAVVPETAKEDLVPAPETTTPAVAKKAVKVTYAPSTDRDPTLSPADIATIKRREADRLRAIEMEKQRKSEAERQRLAEIERLRQLELERLRDPSKEIRGKIRINGIIGEEVFIGNKVYSVGGTVLGAKIISVQPDGVVFLYKGQKFTKKVQLK